MNYLVILILILSSGAAQAVSVYRQGNAIFVSDRGEVRRLPLPLELQNASSFVIQLTPEHKSMTPPLLASQSIAGRGASAGPGGSPSSPSPDGRASMSTLLYKANRLFQEGEYETAMELLNRAEEREPNHARVKTMKGSLFLLMGWKKMARRYWEESLELDPGQSKVRDYLSRLDREGDDQ